ncbi:hypothetical protein Tco_1414450 [Tanacetum coccineum]
MRYHSASITARISEQVKIQLPQILPKEMSNFASPVTTTLTEFELKKILIDKMDKSKSYLAAPKHREYRGLKKRKTSKDAESTKGPKAKESQSGSSRGTKSQPKSSGKSVKSKEPEFEVANSDMPQDQERNLVNDDDEILKKTVSKRDCLASSADKLSKTFDELMSTPIDFSAYIMNGLKITNLNQETLLGPAFRLFKGSHSNYAKLDYDFEECYKALSEKLD